jgi:hypothetical protein
MMNSRFVVALVAVAGFAAPAIPARAQVFEPAQPKILLHVTAQTTKNQCAFPLAGLAGSCLNAVTEASSNGDGSATYFIYIVVAKGDSMLNLAGFQLGIDYDREYAHNSTSVNDHAGIDMFSWSLCASLQFAGSDWTATGAQPVAGNQVTWDPQNTC